MQTLWQEPKPSRCGNNTIFGALLTIFSGFQGLSGQPQGKSRRRRSRSRRGRRDRSRSRRKSKRRSPGRRSPRRSPVKRKEEEKKNDKETLDVLSEVFEAEAAGTTHQHP